MSFRFLPDAPVSAVRMPVGQTVLLDPTLRPAGSCIEVLEGMARVYCPCEETEGMTLAFLQPGDQLRTDRLCSEGVCVEALTPLVFSSEAQPRAGEGFDPVNEWTLQLLRIRHLGSAEQRLHALLALLVIRPFLTEQRLQYVLAVVGGIMIAVCGLELWPEARKCKSDDRLVLGIVCGGVLMGWTLWFGI